ncbi:MAG: S8 family serine peptidase, partial [Bacteroidota bacterium]
MKVKQIACLWSILFILIANQLISQDLVPLKLRSGEIKLEANLESFISETVDENEIVNDFYYRLVQFEKLPTDFEKRQFTSAKVEFEEYFPDNAFIIKIPLEYEKASISSSAAKAVIKLDRHFKLDYRLLNGNIPSHAMAGNKVKVAIIAMKDLDIRDYIEILSNKGLIAYDYGLDSRFGYYELDEREIEFVAQLPWVRYVEIIDEKGEPESTRGRTLQKSNVINNQLNGGSAYDASGVNIMVRDDGLVGPHIDFEGRLLNLTTDATGTHGDGVAGVMGGAGNIDPSVEGGASGADIYVINYVSTFQDNTLDLHQTDNVVITNSSYSNGCNAGYTSTTQTVDRQIHENPTLLHVFSAGNSNNNDCGYGAGNQWGNVTGGHKVGKNVITTANLFYDGTIVSSSSRGPAHDGRIKPDIAAHGQEQMSTDPNNSYSPFGGTSAAAPSMAGNLAQLYQVYKDLNGGNDPKSSLIKAAALNSATDVGNAGPDFIHGYGLINTGRAYEIIQGNQYLFSSVSQGGSNSHTINVPSGLAQLRVMIYWHDPEASVGANKALVNDLDLNINGSLLPLVLDPTPNPTNLNTPATPGIDRLNNQEQVVIENPTAGNYTANITGFQIPQGPQEYVLVYSFIKNEIKVTYPLGGESLIPGDVETIHWDAIGNSGNFSVEYSTNNGASWTSIGSVAGDQRLIDWTVPNVNTGQALVRVSRSGLTDTSDEGFNIFPIPNFNVVATSNSTASVSWTSITGATDYDVYTLGAKYMEVIGSSTSNSYEITGLNIGDAIWVSVAANGSGIEGQRANAILYTFQPGSSCGGCLSGSTDFPHFQGFETDFGDFCNSTADDIDFQLNSGTTPSSNTGPSSASQGSQYIYLETSTPNHPSKTSILGSRCYDLSNAASASLSFDYHMYGASMGSLVLQVSTDGGASWSSDIWSRSGDQGNTWFSETIDFSAYQSDLVSYRFIATSGNSWQSDIALDNITFDATINTSDVIGEVGTVVTNHVNTTVNFQNSYTNPIIVAGAPTRNGGDPSTVRISNITSTGFDIRIDEYEYLDESHTTEKIGYMVMEAGEYTLEDGNTVKAGSITANSNLSTYNMPGSVFASRPTLVASCVSINDPDAVAVRVRNISTSSFELEIEEEELVRTHGDEEVHWIAMGQASGFSGLDYQSEVTPRAVTHNNYILPLDQAYTSNSVYIGMMNSRFGGDVSSTRINEDYQGTGNLATFVEEEKSRDTEIAHTTEEIGFIIFYQNGNILGNLADNDYYGRSITLLNPKTEQEIVDIQQ